MAPPFQTYIIAFCTKDFGKRQLVTEKSASTREILISVIEHYGGFRIGEWWCLPDVHSCDKAMETAKQLGGIVFDLPESKPPLIKPKPN